MLGLRGSPLSKRPNNVSNSVASLDKNSKEKANMALSANPSNGTEVFQSTSDSSKVTGTNGKLHHEDTHVESHSETYSQTMTTDTRTSKVVTTKTEEQLHFSSDQQVTVLRETIIPTRRRFIAELQYVDERYIDGMTSETFFEYIERERLTQMPHKGSKWDRVLKWAEFFALQVSYYEGAIASFVPSSKAASKLMLTACRVLLELGHGNQKALEATFGAFYKLGLSISFLLRHVSLLHVNAHLRSEVGLAFNDLLILVSDVTVTYYQKIKGLSSGPVRLEFNEFFGRQIATFTERKSHIVDAMWEYQLGNDASMNTRKIRKWLKPYDKTVQNILHLRQEALERRAEYTCEWFERDLLDFSRGKKDVLVVHGPEGCGKSVLFSWIIERLQRPLAKKSFVTLSYFIPQDIPSESSSLAIAKSLALQLLETNVGDKMLFEKIKSVYDLALKLNESDTIEKGLWEALETGLKSFDASPEKLMIVVDGLDEASNDGSKEVLRRLESLSTKCKGLQTILLARSLSTANTVVQSVQITKDNTHNDMEHVVTQALKDCAGLKEQNEFDREKVVEQIVHNAQGSFLWAALATAILKREEKHAAFLAALKEMPKKLQDLLKKLFDIVDLKKPDIKLLLEWLLVAQRPLTLAEVTCLYRVDFQKKALTDRKTDIGADILRPCEGLVHVQDGIIAFRHRAIHTYLIEVAAKKAYLLPQEDAQEDIAKRILTYCKLSLEKSYEPVFEIPGAFDIEELFQKHPLLDYSVKYWLQHFKASSLYQETVKLQFPPELKDIFPGSPVMALLEWKSWDYQTSMAQAAASHNVALRIREAIFTEAHELVLQNLIICGKFHSRFQNTKDATSCFYRASRIGQKILHQFSSVTISCTTSFLSLTDNITYSTRTSIVTEREEMLKFIIAASKHQHGKTSEVVVKYYKLLAQLYVDIHEESRAEEVWKELRQIIILRHGKGSEEEMAISQNMVIVLKKGLEGAPITDYETNIFEAISKMEIWDIRRIEMILTLAKTYESRGELFLAEEQYIILWRHLTEHCHQSHTHYGVETHISVIDVALEYTRFLRRHSRDQEAAGILICIWSEYEDFEFESETIFLRLKSIGELMRTVRLLSLAISVFKKCSAWFKYHEKHEYEASCEVLISTTVEEITTITTIVNTTTETTIKEVFETAIFQKTVTKESLKICQNLINLYMRLEQWTEAISVTEKTLSLVWKTIISRSGTIALPRFFDSEAISTAVNLAICHHRLHHFHEAEDIYIYIYRACKISCRINDERMLTSYTTLVKFYEEHRHWHKMIEIYREVLIEYRTHLGASHALTIQTLYILGSVCIEHGNGRGIEYYEEIVTVLNGKNRVCHNDAREAMMIICRTYYEDGHWLKFQDVCKILWETWTHHHKEHKFDAEFIELLYKRYVYVLEHHLHCEYEVIRVLTVQYRDTCVKVFGAFSMIAITAMIKLAQISYRSEKHIHEAISIYEEVIQKTSTSTTVTSTTTTITVSTTTMTTIKKHLTDAYVRVCSHGSVSMTTVEKAIKILLERFEYLKRTLGCAHSETLIVFRELLLLYAKLKTEESHATLIRKLTAISVEIVCTETHSKTLHEAAIALGGIFTSLELAKNGIEMISEMRKQMIAKNSAKSNKYGFSIEGKATKASLIFIVTLDRVLNRSMAFSYSEIMTEILIEKSLYEHYGLCLKSETDVTILLTHAARLHEFLVARNRAEEARIVESHTFEIFLKTWGSTLLKTASKDVTLVFFVGLLKQLGVDGREMKFGTAACLASIETVKEMVEANKFKAALDVSQCAFAFLNHQRTYHHLENIPYSFKLSALLARYDSSGNMHKEQSAADSEIRKEMLQLSQTIIREVFAVLKEFQIDILRLKPEDLNNLIALLGTQQNYADLEWLLKSLWGSRELHKKWDRAMIPSIGKYLAIAHSLADHHSQAIKICEDICYNLRRVHGILSPKALAMEELLSQIYTRAGHYREAMGVHEDIIRHIVDGDDGDDRTIDTVHPLVARRHLDLLRCTYLRLKGWDKSASNYHDLVRELMNMREFRNATEFKDALPAEKWSLKDDPGTFGLLAAPKEWRIIGDNDDTAAARPRLGMKRASSNWASKFLHDIVYGDHEDEDEETPIDVVAKKPHRIFHDGNRNGVLPKVREHAK